MSDEPIQPVNDDHSQTGNDTSAPQSGNVVDAVTTGNINVVEAVSSAEPSPAASPGAEVERISAQAPLPPVPTEEQQQAAEKARVDEMARIQAAVSHPKVRVFRDAAQQLIDHIENLAKEAGEEMSAELRDARTAVGEAHLWVVEHFKQKV